MRVHLLGAEANLTSDVMRAGRHHALGINSRLSFLEKLAKCVLGAAGVNINLAVRRKQSAKSLLRSCLFASAAEAGCLKCGGAARRLQAAAALQKAHTYHLYVRTYGIAAGTYVCMYSLVNESALFVIRAACASLSAAGRNSARVLRCKLAQNE